MLKCVAILMAQMECKNLLASVPYLILVTARIYIISVGISKWYKNLKQTLPGSYMVVACIANRPFFITWHGGWPIV